MPIGACDRCQRVFVIESERSPQRTCPHCLHPMRVMDKAEAFDHLRHPPELIRHADGHGSAVEATDLGRRTLTVLAESAAIRAEAEECRKRARKLRRALLQARQTIQTTRKNAPPAQATVRVGGPT